MTRAGLPGARRAAQLRPADYLGALTGDISGLRVAVVTEGFGIEGLSEDDVDAAVRDAAYALAKLGARVQDVSIPWHRDAMAVWNAIALEGATRQMVAGEGMGNGWKGQHRPRPDEHYSAGRRG